MKKYILLFIILSLPIIVAFSQEDKQDLEKRLSEIYNTDQSIRKSLGEINSKYAGKAELKEKMDSVISQMLKIDKENQQFISTMLDSDGWPSGLSFEGNMAIFMVIQHGGPDYMNKYASVVEEEYTKGNIIPSLYAIFRDRILMYADKFQIYGSQIVNGYVWPIEDPENVDIRRKEMDLSPMEEYLKLFGNTAIWDKNITIEDIKAKMRH